jgi:hypothetical protein
MPLADSFRAARWVRTFNLLVQAVLFLTFFGGLNYVARDYPALRYDLTQRRRFSLSPETRSYLKNLSRPVTIVATVSDEAELPLEVNGLIDEYVHATEASAHGPIHKEIVNIYQNRRRAEELGLEQPGVLVLLCGDKRNAVSMSSLYQVHKTERGPERTAFIGEQALTAAVLEVSNPDRLHLYFLVGHGELQPDDANPARGLSALTAELKIRNFKVDTLELSVNRTIPPDAALLIAVGPQSAYTAAEQEMLRQYLSVKAGRCLLLLAPGLPVARLGLDDLLFDWGVLVDDDVVCETDPSYRTDDGDLIIRGLDPKHPITQSLVDYSLPLSFGYTRTVRPVPGRAIGGGLSTTVVAATSPSAWGDVGYHQSLPPKSDNYGNIHPLAGVSPPGSLGVVVASERVAPRDNSPFSVRAGRLVVFGTGDFVANHRLSNAGNEAIFLNAVNWAVERDRQLNIPVRPIERFQLAMSAADLNRMHYALWFALPGIAAALGLMVYWTRRK